MPMRASLTGCVKYAIARFASRAADFAIITHNTKAKYYTLYHPSEFDARLINRPTTEERVVLACSPGQLASIISTAQFQLKLDLDALTQVHPPPLDPNQTPLFTEQDIHATTDSLEGRQQPRNHHTQTVRPPDEDH